jgi:hypothetical protein
MISLCYLNLAYLNLAEIRLIDGGNMLGGIYGLNSGICKSENMGQTA